MPRSGSSGSKPSSAKKAKASPYSAKDAFGPAMALAILDDVEGVGPGRKKALIRKFGSVKRMRDAEIGDLAEVVPDRVAKELYAALHEV